MKKHFLLLATIATLSLSSCSDNDTLANYAPPAKEQNSIIVNGQSAKSVLTLGFLMANHTELPTGSRATDYGYEYDDDDGVFMTEEEAAAFLAPYTQMGRDLRDVLIRSYFPATSRSGEDDGGGGETPGGDGNHGITGGGNGGVDPWNDPLIGTLAPEDQEEVNMLYQMTDEQVTEVALILSTMAFDDQILEVNGCQITVNHAVDCLIYAVGLKDLYDTLKNITKYGAGFLASRQLWIKLSKHEIIRVFGSVMGRYVLPGLALVYATYRFVDCLADTSMQVLSSTEYQNLLDEYNWLTEFDTVVFEITLD